MRIPLSHITMPLKNLNFNVLEKKGNPIEGREVLMYQDLFSQPVHSFSNSNPLFSVPMGTARKSARPGRVTIISGSLYSALVQYAGAQEAEPGWSAHTKGALLTLRQVSAGSPTGPIEALDYLIYFLLASCQGHNNDYDDDDNREEMETLLLSKMTEQPRKVKMEARANLFHQRHEITCRKSATGGPESLPDSPRRSLKIQSERHMERSPSHSSKVSNSSRKHHSEPRTGRWASSRERRIWPTSTPPPFGVPRKLARFTSARPKSTKKRAQIYGMDMLATSPSLVASSPGSMKSTAAAYDSDDSPLLQMPPALSYGGPNSADSADLKTISTLLFNLQRITTQVA